MGISITNWKRYLPPKVLNKKAVLYCRGEFLAFCVVICLIECDLSDFSNSWKVISSLSHLSPIKSHFSGISHAQTPAMITRINLLSLDQVSSSSEYPLLTNSEKYSNFQNPSRLACNEFWHGWSTVHLFSLTVSRLKRTVDQPCQNLL